MNTFLRFTLLFSFALLSLNVSAQIQKKYYESGTLKQIGKLKNEKREGKWKFYRKNGTISEEYNYLNGVRYGTQTYYNYNGNITREEIYNKDGQRETIHYYYEKFLRSTANYEKGDVVRFTYFDKKGKKIGDYSNIEGVKNGCKMKFGRDGLKSIDCYEDNQIVSHKYLVNDTFVKSEDLYLDKGKKRRHRMYKDDGSISYDYIASLDSSGDYQKDPIVRRYYQNGELKAEYDAYGLGPGGDFKSYYQSGALKAEGNYSNKEKTGAWKYYHENGKVKRIGNYTNGEEIGEWKNYDTNGKEKETPSYEPNPDLLKIVKETNYKKYILFKGQKLSDIKNALDVRSTMYNNMDWTLKISKYKGWILGEFIDTKFNEHVYFHDASMLFFNEPGQELKITESDTAIAIAIDPQNKNSYVAYINQYIFENQYETCEMYGAFQNNVNAIFSSCFDQIVSSNGYTIPSFDEILKNHNISLSEIQNNSTKHKIFHVVSK